MQKKLTITIDEEIYRGLYTNIGEGRISKFIEHLVKPYVLNVALEQEYKNISANEREEQEAYEWIEGCIGDVDKTR